MHGLERAGLQKIGTTRPIYRLLKHEDQRRETGRANHIGHNWEACVEWFIDRSTTGAVTYSIQKELVELAQHNPDTKIALGILGGIVGIVFVYISRYTETYCLQY